MKINVTFAIESELLKNFIDIVEETNSTPDEEFGRIIDRYIKIHSRDKNNIDIQNDFENSTYQRHSFEFFGESFSFMVDLVFAAVKKYVDDHPDITFKELKKVFPDDWIGNFPYVIEKYFLVNDESRHRFLCLPSSGTIGITTQWKFDNYSFWRFLNGVNQTLDEKYFIKIVC